MEYCVVLEVLVHENPFNVFLVLNFCDDIATQVEKTLAHSVSAPLEERTCVSDSIEV